MKQKYKALMLDLDGTTFPNKTNAIPSQKVITSIEKASKVLHVGVATSRPLFMATPMIKMLNLSAFCIVDGGAIILDPISKKNIWEQPLNKDDILHVYHVAEQLQYPLIYSEGHSQKKFDKDHIPRKILGIFFENLSHAEAERIEALLSHISTISLHKIVSEHPGFVHIKVRHAVATKQQGILTVAELLKIDTHEIIGVGEGYNDFSLLMACGLKIAMGNAVPDLKAIADYIAPSVDDDGVAHVIEKFVLNQK